MGGVVEADANPTVEALARASAASSVIGTTRGKVLSNHMATVSTRESLLGSLAISRLLHNVHVWGNATTKAMVTL
eukprot:10853243-Alexandrium_andersonii.AAC.1